MDLTYFFWKASTGSEVKSDMSSVLPFSITNGCFFISSQPMWAKKKPRLMLCLEAMRVLLRLEIDPLWALTGLRQCPSTCDGTGGPVTIR